ncbi:hypothetical protein MAPG_01729 [Magnaporthiopsis poae ATCC 64411]|uniref:Uncharacterized protein n=1 Tax=Magnaporthiopsis poae (strain ATCC 64411 / 73-15) TaxID=644358 RepID=A0A0C4DPG4_MAGP6|nr:hypothetical protein MAPG_01729 [Magnaporthiopsis poae ATCC 64411]
MADVDVHGKDSHQSYSPVHGLGMEIPIKDSRPATHGGRSDAQHATPVTRHTTTSTSLSEQHLLALITFSLISWSISGGTKHSLSHNLRDLPSPALRS